jgi:hypothetical protein
LSNLAVEVRDPHNLEAADLVAADVIAIDQFYDWEVVPHPQEMAYWPEDGLALAAVISRRLAKLDSHAAIVLRTGQLGDLAGELPKAARIPLLAMQNNLDWVIEKGDETAALKIHQIAEAAARLRPFTSGQPIWNEGAEWLGLSSHLAWSDAALAEVQVCRPPEHVVAQYTAGAAWLRWFAHRVLPFPSFLVSDLKAATLLGISLRQLQKVLTDSNSGLQRRLDEFVYRGSLAGLVERRWWRAGLETFVDHLLLETSGELEVRDALAGAYGRLHGDTIGMLSQDHPVVTIDSEYAEDGVSEASECFRLAPDRWPVFADEPWAAREDVADDSVLAAMVSRGDRGRLREMGVSK